MFCPILAPKKGAAIALVPLLCPFRQKEVRSGGLAEGAAADCGRRMRSKWECGERRSGARNAWYNLAMALLKKSRGRKDNDSGYSRMIGNDEVGSLLSRVHATAIRAGSELERMVRSNIHIIEDLTSFLSSENMPEGVWLADKKMVKKCPLLDSPRSEPDFIIFKRRGEFQACHIVELKDGDAFDTKKAAGEKASMDAFIAANEGRIPYEVHSHFCCFNQDSREAIHEGFKKKIALEETMTGREFCDFLEIDYDEIVRVRKEHASENFRTFFEELLGIPEAAKMIEELQNEKR